jgi:GNAT superfamily N-acetyltransferase
MERRPAHLPDDLAELLAMQQASWEINFPGEPFSESVFRHALERAVPTGDILVYIEDGVIVGWLWLDWRVGRERAHIRHLQVAEPWWGRGYGRMLVQDAICLARDKGRSELTLNVTKTNARAMQLYASAGFVIRQDMGDRQHMSCDLQQGQVSCEVDLSRGS